MGGAAPVETGKKGKKSLDAELNLVPFIDLLSCLISFLLITAVWTQISKVHAQSTGSLTTQDTPPPDNPNVTTVRVLLTDRGYSLTVGGAATPDLPKTSVAPGRTTPGGYDTKSLGERLIEVKKRFSEQRAVTIAAEDGVNFEDLAGTIDAIVADPVALPDISVTPATS